MEKYIQPFIDVTVNVFRDFVGCELTAGRPFFVTAAAENAAEGAGNEHWDWDISGIIGLTGEARGAVVISMKRDLAATLTARITGQDAPSSNAEIIDAVGELVNIIAGNAKRGLEESFHLIISLPTIVEGKGHLVKWPEDQVRIISIPFTLLETHRFCLSVAIESVKGTP
jgi:chemotaxis protein CheX